MSMFAIMGAVFVIFASVCVAFAVMFICVGYLQETDLVERLCEYGAELARRRKGR